MRKLLWGSCLLAGIAVAANAQNTAIKGATATVTNFNPAKGTATVEVSNQSDKDITAYSLAIETVFKDHQIDRSERMGDYGAAMTARGEALHPGLDKGTRRAGHPLCWWCQRNQKHGHRPATAMCFRRRAICGPIPS